MYSLAAEAASSACARCTVARHAIYSPAFASIPRAILRRRRGRTVLPAKRTIFREGKVPEQVFTLVSGWAYRYRTLPEGGRQILSFYIPGDFIAVQAMNPTPLAFTVKTLTEVALCGFDRQDLFDFLLEMEPLREKLCRDMLAQFDGAEETLVDVGRRSATARVARFLLALESRLAARGLSEDGAFELPIPQGLIADALGLTQMHVNRTLGAIRDSGAIAFRRNEMRILSFDDLSDLAEDSGSAAR